MHFAVTKVSSTGENWREQVPHVGVGGDDIELTLRVDEGITLPAKYPWIISAGHQIDNFVESASVKVVFPALGNLVHTGASPSVAQLRKLKQANESPPPSPPSQGEQFMQ
jgi:hypothetical protein